MADLTRLRGAIDVDPSGASVPPDRRTGAADEHDQTRVHVDEVIDRLLALGVSRTTSEELLSQYPVPRVVDALHAVEVLDEGTVRRPAGWVVAAIREGWDLTDVLTERREQQAWERHWRRQQEHRDRLDAEHDAREERAAGWSAAISEALDDCYLELAIQRVSEPVGALERRSVPVTRAQILGWAVAAADRHPHLTLRDALEHELDSGEVSTRSLRRQLPEAPPTRAASDDLAGRIAAAFEACPDLAHPPRDARPERGIGRDLGASLEL